MTLLPRHCGEIRIEFRPVDATGRDVHVVSVPIDERTPLTKVLDEARQWLLEGMADDLARGWSKK